MKAKLKDVSTAFSRAQGVLSANRINASFIAVIPCVGRTVIQIENQPKLRNLKAARVVRSGVNDDLGYYTDFEYDVNREVVIAWRDWSMRDCKVEHFGGVTRRFKTGSRSQ